MKQAAWGKDVKKGDILLWERASPMRGPTITYGVFDQESPRRTATVRPCAEPEVIQERLLVLSIEWESIPSMWGSEDQKIGWIITVDLDNGSEHHHRITPRSEVYVELPAPIENA